MSAPRTLAEALELLPFQRELIDYLRADEGGLWQWYSSADAAEEQARAVRLELLKSCYRCERSDHVEWYAAADSLREQLGMTAPVTLYQSQEATALNAFLSYAPGEAHVVFEGPVRATLTPDEVRSVLAHELTHFLLWEQGGGDLRHADLVLGAMSSHPRAERSHVETARIFTLYLEVQADRGAAVTSPDPLVAVSSLIKVQTGLADAKAESYIRQSEEIFGQEDVKTDGFTHPEAFIRARAVTLWTARGAEADPEIARMIEGPLDVRRLTLPGQRRLTEATRFVLGRFLRPAWLRGEARLAHARMYFPDLDPDRDGAEGSAAPAALAKMSDSVADYVCYVLLDMATVEQQADEPALAAGLRLADDLGVAERFLALATRELGLTRRAANRLGKDAAHIVARAGAEPGGAS